VHPLSLAHAVLVMSAAEVMQPMPVTPDAAMIADYAEVVFGWCEGWVAVRALAEKGGPDRAPHTPFLPADAELPAKLAVQAQWAAQAGMALYVIPGTVPEPGQASAEHIAQMQVVLVDLDGGDIAAKRAHLLHHLGAPSLEVASGGVTPEGQEKLHLYWRLTEPATGEDLATVCRLRHAIAVKVGGDPAFRSAHQPIRVAGSIHAKGGQPRLVAILAWAIEGCLEWQRVGLRPPATVLAATDEYFEAEDALGRWIEECCEQGPAFSETTATLFASWKAWAEAGGEYVGSIKRFSQTLTARGFERCRAAASTPRGFRGIALKPRQPGITDMEF
jgi:hypothetical protein